MRPINHAASLLNPQGRLLGDRPHPGPVNPMQPTHRNRLAGLVLAALALALAGAAYVPTATAQVCLPSTEPGAALCGGDIVCSVQLAAAPKSEQAAQVTTTACALTENCIQGGRYTITVNVQEMGPLDTVLGEVTCNGEHVAACTVSFTDLDRTCSDTSDVIDGSLVGPLGCVRTDFDRFDGFAIKATHGCAEPPYFPDL
jgi:predicted membrane metal-binding protein